MEAMTKSWTDERLEERFDRVDQRFDETDRRIDAMDRRLEQRFDRVESDSRELRGEMNGRFDATQHLIIRIGAGMLVTLIVGFVGVIATLATQL